MNSWFHDVFREGGIFEWALPLMVVAAFIGDLKTGDDYLYSAVMGFLMVLGAAYEMHRYRTVSDKITKAADAEIAELNKKINKLEDEVWELKKSKWDS